MDEMGYIPQASQRQNVSHSRSRRAQLRGNLINFISISKERMCQSEGGFGAEEMRKKWGNLGCRMPRGPEGKGLALPLELLWPWQTNP